MPERRAAVVVIEHRHRHTPEEGEGVNVTIDPGFGDRRRIRPDITGIAVREIKGKEMGLLFDPTDDDHRLAEVGLRMTRRMDQRHEHLPPPPFALAHVILHDGVAAREAMFCPKTLEHPFGRVALFTVPALILDKPSIDDLGKPIQLRPFDLGLAPVAGRHRKRQHLADAVARYPEMQCSSSRAHAVSTRQTDLPVKFHGENTPTLPVTRKGKSGRLLRRPQPDHPAAPVADFVTDGLTQGYNYPVFRRTREWLESERSPRTSC